MIARRATATLALSISALAGCAGTRQAAIEIGPPGAETVHVDDEAQRSTARPDGPGCVWTGTHITPRGDGLPLCFAVDGACFAQTTAPFAGRATVSFPEGKPAETGAKLDLVDEGIRLSAWTAGDAVVLFAQQPLSVGPAAVVIGGPSLFVERVHGGAVDLSFRGDASVKPRGGAFRGQAPCPLVGLAPDRWDPESVLAVAGVARGAATDRLLPVDQPLALSVTPGGASTFEIVAPAEETSRVEVVDQRGPFARLLWWQPDGGLVFGWVDGSALLPAPPLADSTGSGVGSPAPAMGSVPFPGMECPVDVPLFAQVSGLTEEVGAILAGTRFDASKAIYGEYRLIRIRSRHVDSLPESRWLVRSADVAACPLD